LRHGPVVTVVPPETARVSSDYGTGYHATDE